MSHVLNIDQIEHESHPVNVPQIIEDLNSLVTLMQKYVQTGSLTIEEDNQFLRFFLQYKNTNDLVFYALEAMSHEPQSCLDEFAALQNGAEQFLAYYDSIKDQLRTLNFQTESNNYLRPFKEELDQCVADANALWKVFQEASNRLDYIDERDSDYEYLRKDLDEKEALYKKAHSLVDEKHAILKDKEKDVYALYSFEFEMLLIVADKLKQISLSVINDINNMEKGDCK